MFLHWDGVDERIGKEVRTFLGVEDVHRAEVLVLRADADDFFGHLDGIAVFGVQSGDECVASPVSTIIMPK